MKTLKCPNCGAMVNANAKKCDYCNTKFETTELKLIDTVEPNKTTKMPELTEQELVANLKNYLQSNNSMLAIIPLIIFLIAWISIGLTMAGNVIGTFGAMGIAPLFITLAGSSFLITAIVSALKHSNTKLRNIVNTKELEEVYQISKSESYKSQSMLVVSILIGHYYIKDSEYVKNAIKLLKPITLAQSIQQTFALKNVCDYYGYQPTSLGFNSISNFSNFK